MRFGIAPIRKGLQNNEFEWVVGWLVGRIKHDPEPDNDGVDKTLKCATALQRKTNNSNLRGRGRVRICSNLDGIKSNQAQILDRVRTIHPKNNPAMDKCNLTNQQLIALVLQLKYVMNYAVSKR